MSVFLSIILFEVCVSLQILNSSTDFRKKLGLRVHTCTLQSIFNIDIDQYPKNRRAGIKNVRVSKL